MVQRGAERDHEIRPGEQLDGERRREATGDAYAVPVAGEEPVPHGARRQKRPYPITQSFERLARVGEGGTASRDDHLKARRGEQLCDPCDRAGGRVRRLQRRRVGDGRGLVGRHPHEVDRDAQHDGTALDLRTLNARAASSAAVFAPRTRPAIAPATVARAPWSILKFDQSVSASVSAASTSTGVRFFAASVSPVSVSVKPGPWWTLTTPTFPQARA